MKQILIGVLIFLIILPVVSASCSCGYVYNANGYTYPNEGYMYAYASATSPPSSCNCQSQVYLTTGNTVYYKYGGSVYAHGAAGHPSQCASATTDIINAAYGTLVCNNQCDGDTCSDTCNGIVSSSASIGPYASAGTAYSGSTGRATMIIYVKITEFLNLTISGNTCGISGVDLYIKNASAYNLIESDTLTETGDSYLFNVTENLDYKIIFSDSHEYEFTPTYNDITYNRDLCSYYTINLLDNCSNKLIKPIVTVYDITNDTYPRYKVDPEWYDELGKIKLLLNNEIYIGDEVHVCIETTAGKTNYTDTVAEKETNMYDRVISWYLNVHVVDDNTTANIQYAKVILSQNCRIIPPYTTHSLTQADGYTIFNNLANSNIDINIEKTGYTTYSKKFSAGSVFNCWATGGQVTVYMNASGGNGSDNWNNETHNDSAADGEGGETLPEDHAYGCGIYFKNTDGKITNTILDTDTYVDLHYWVKGSDATLKFQHQIYTYWYTDEEYSVFNNTFEYRRILNANFSDYTDAYRGYIYNSSHECNNTQRLYVINKSYQEETDYKNLTSHCWIKNKLSGNEIDYRSDIKCVIYANSTNSSLMDITAHFMNQSMEVDSLVLNWADFISGTPKWYYVWYPSYEYQSGYNYTLNITGYDGYQLDTDMVWTADIIGNTLTVYVKDNHNAPLAYSTVFVQGWGSSALDSSTDISITGLSDGNVQYKATKTGYLSSAWSNITLDGSDESVTCILTESVTESVTGYKLKDSEIKEFFIPLMYMLLIMILLGGFMNAAKK